MTASENNVWIVLKNEYEDGYDDSVDKPEYSSYKEIQKVFSSEKSAKKFVKDYKVAWPYDSHLEIVQQPIED